MKFRYLFLLLAFLLLGCSHTKQPSTPVSTTYVTTTTPTDIFSPQFGVKYKVKVIDVIDGDTIDVILPNGSIDRIRMLCVDTPETSAERNKPYEYDDITDLECLEYWGKQAKTFATNTLEGKEVYIEFDDTAGLRGYYGRLLAYIYINGTDFTAELVKKGYARVYEEGECRKEAKYLQYQQQAMQSSVGLWSCRYATTATTSTSSASTTVRTETSTTMPAEMQMTENV
jgi:micrococcal nuclease